MTQLVFELLLLAGLASWLCCGWLLAADQPSRRGKVVTRLIFSVGAVVVVALNWHKIVEDFRLGRQVVSTDETLGAVAVLLLTLIPLVYTVVARLRIDRDSHRST